MFRAARLENAGGSAGFTIIEVLIALAVIAVCLAAIGTVVGVTSRGVRSLEQRVALVEVARSVAASLPPHSDRAVVPAAGEILGHRWQIDVRRRRGPAVASWNRQIPRGVRRPSRSASSHRPVRSSRSRQCACRESPADDE